MREFSAQGLDAGNVQRLRGEGGKGGKDHNQPGDGEPKTKRERLTPERMGEEGAGAIGDLAKKVVGVVMRWFFGKGKRISQKGRKGKAGKRFRSASKKGRRIPFRLADRGGVCVRESIPRKLSTAKRKKGIAKS